MFNRSLDNTRTTRRVLLKEKRAGLRNRMPKMWGGERFRPSGNFNFRMLRLGPKKSVKNRARALNMGRSLRNNNNNNNNKRRTRKRNNNMNNSK